MQDIATILKTQGFDAPLDGVEPNIERLQELPPTAAVAEVIADLQRAIDETPATAATRRTRLLGDLAYHERRLAWAKRRDELSAARPAGCWCLGIGGRRKTYVAADSAVTGWAEYCPCPEGYATAAAVQAERERLGLAWAEQRRVSLVELIWSGANIPAHYAGFTLESFPVCDQTRPVVERLREWQQTDRWLVLWGRRNGTGKTGLGVSLLRAAAEAGQTVLFQTLPDLLDRIRDSYDENGPLAGVNARDVLGAITDVDLLLIDDTGKERVNGWVAERLFVIFNRRHGEHRQTILTSNLHPQQLADKWGDQHGEAVMWRICELAGDPDNPDDPYILELAGPNLRDPRNRRA